MRSRKSRVVLVRSKLLICGQRMMFLLQAQLILSFLLILPFFGEQTQLSEDYPMRTSKFSSMRMSLSCLFQKHLPISSSITYHRTILIQVYFVNSPQRQLLSLTFLDQIIHEYQFLQLLRLLSR